MRWITFISFPVSSVVFGKISLKKIFRFILRIGLLWRSMLPNAAYQKHFGALMFKSLIESPFSPCGKVYRIQYDDTQWVWLTLKIILSKTAFAKSGGTAFPTCCCWKPMDPVNSYQSGKDCKRAASLTDSPLCCVG